MTSNIPRGYVVAIEGIDAAGKNTQSQILFRLLVTKGVKATRMSFPDYETAIGREIKSFLSGEKSYPVELQHLLFAANRWEKRDEIRARLRAGEILIVNRYTESNLAYGVANGLNADWLASLENGLPKSNLVVVLDAPVRSLSSRRTGASKDAYERSSALQSKAQKAYRQLARKRGWKLVGANGTVEEVRAAIMTAVREALERDRRVSI